MEENTCSCTCEGCVERERPCSQSTETRPESSQRHQTNPSPYERPCSQSTETRPESSQRHQTNPSPYERPCSQSTETRPGSNQRHQTDPSPAQGDRSTVIDLPVASENLSQPNDSVCTEELPEYDSVVLGTTTTDGGRSRVIYENVPVVNKDVEAAREETLIDEAPPTYRQLFGERRSSGQRWKLPGSRSSSDQSLVNKMMERLENNKLASTFVVSGVILLLLSLPLAMIIIGALNVEVCDRHEIPLYLMIAGFILIAEIIYQTTLCIAIKRNKRHESTYRVMRMCDCLALFLFIWLLVGSYWIFTISLDRQACISYGNDFVYVNTTVVPDGEGNGNPGCPDCDSYVYNFSTFVIMLQYIGTLCLMVWCCSCYVKHRGNRPTASLTS